MTSLQHSMLAVLVMDLGYTKAPVHGHTPLRHQIAWDRAVEGLEPDRLEYEIQCCLEDKVIDDAMGA